jgi:hypothetical protein
MSMQKLPMKVHDENPSLHSNHSLLHLHSNMDNNMNMDRIDKGMNAYGLAGVHVMEA